MSPTAGPSPPTAPAAPRPPKARWRPALGPLAVAAWAVAILVWLLDRGGSGLPAAVGTAVATLALAAGAAWLGSWAARAWASGRGRGMLGGERLLLLLLLLSFAVRLAGLGWEAGQGYYRDEGIYLKAAERIQAGELLPRSFIYGHLTYYLTAFVLWLRELFPGPANGLAAALGARDGAAELWVLLRLAGALLGALTTGAVFAIARRVAGRPAAALAALLIVFSPLYNEIAHLLISDGPSAFFATWSLAFVARLLDRERLADYLGAGVAAGLAAGSKYPAGVVAVGVVAVWAWWRARERRWSWSLGAAGLAAIAAFLAVMPALLVAGGAAFSGAGRDILFGVRQYAEGGWIGVRPDSNALWYAGQAVDSFGWAAVVAGLSGLAWVGRRRLGRLALMMVYLLVFLALLSGMSMVVKRNLQPVMPMLAVLLGVGASGWWELARRGSPGVRRAVEVGCLVLVLTQPVVETVAQDLSMVRLGTRELALDWIAEHVPPGAAFVKESYTPRLDARRYVWRQSRFAARLPLEEVRDPANDFLLLAAPAYGRFLDPANLIQPHHRLFAERYRKLLALPRVREFTPGMTRRGPALALYRLDPPTVEHRRSWRFTTDQVAFASRPALAARADGAAIPFADGGGYVLFKGYFAAGRYRVTLDGELPAGRARLEVVSRDNRPTADLELTAGATTLALPSADKYFLYLHLPPGGALRGLLLENPRAGGADGG